MIRLWLGDAPLGIDEAAMEHWILDNVPESFMSGQGLDPKSATFRIGAAQVARAGLALLKSLLRRYGMPQDMLPALPRHADPINYGVKYIIWLFARFMASQEWEATYRETEEGIEITGLGARPPLDDGQPTVSLSLPEVAGGGALDGVADSHHATQPTGAGGGEARGSLDTAGHIGERQDDGSAGDCGELAAHVAGNPALRVG